MKPNYSDESAKSAQPSCQRLGSALHAALTDPTLTFLYHVRVCVWWREITMSDCQLIPSALSLCISKSMHTHSHMHKRACAYTHLSLNITHPPVTYSLSLYLALSHKHICTSLFCVCATFLHTQRPQTNYVPKIQQDAQVLYAFTRNDSFSEHRLS